VINKHRKPPVNDRLDEKQISIRGLCQLKPRPLPFSTEQIVSLLHRE